MKKNISNLLYMLVALSSFLVSCGSSGDSPYNGHKYVDLGLPSGIKWATCNVGASAPEEFGGYYAWGETDEKDEYSWSTYKWCNGSSTTLTKYCTNSRFGTVDNKTVLDPQDDVAHVKWGGKWRMPTLAEINELRENCTWSSHSKDGVISYKITGPNGNSIILPFAGLKRGSEVYYSGSCYGQYWSSSLVDGDYEEYAYELFFGTNTRRWDLEDRCLGLCVRPVCE